MLVVYWYTRDIRTIVTLPIFTSPAELGLATPLVMLAAMARAARSGILTKGGMYLETLAKADVVMFDMAGTLTANGPIEAAVLHLGPDILDFVNSVKLLRLRIDGLPAVEKA
jgi:cation transport ATPase